MIQVTLTQEPQVFVSADGSRHSIAPPKNPAVTYLYMRWNNGRWQAAEIELG